MCQRGAGIGAVSPASLELAVDAAGNPVEILAGCAMYRENLLIARP